MISCEFREISNGTFSYRTPPLLSECSKNTVTYQGGQQPLKPLKNPPKKPWNGWHPLSGPWNTLKLGWSLKNREKNACKNWRLVRNGCSGSHIFGCIIKMNRTNADIFSLIWNENKITHAILTKNMFCYDMTLLGERITFQPKTFFVETYSI